MRRFAFAGVVGFFFLSGLTLFSTTMGARLPFDVLTTVFLLLTGGVLSLLLLLSGGMYPHSRPDESETPCKIVPSNSSQCLVTRVITLVSVRILPKGSGVRR